MHYPKPPAHHTDPPPSWPAPLLQGLYPWLEPWPTNRQKALDRHNAAVKLLGLHLGQHVGGRGALPLVKQALISRFGPGAPTNHQKDALLEECQKVRARWRAGAPAAAALLLLLRPRRRGREAQGRGDGRWGWEAGRCGEARRGVV